MFVCDSDNYDPAFGYAYKPTAPRDKGALLLDVALPESMRRRVAARSIWNEETERVEVVVECYNKEESKAWTLRFIFTPTFPDHEDIALICLTAR